MRHATPTWRRLCRRALFCWSALGITCAWTQVAAQTNPPPHHHQFEPAIRAFEAADRTNPPPRGAVLLVGSSSIRLWTNAPAQFPAHRLVLRGFGGSHLADCVAYAQRIILPYHPRLILVYAGDNDINAGKSPEQVLADFQALVATVHAALPETQIAFISIKPSPARARHLDAIQIANRLIRQWAATNPRLHYLDIFTPMLDGEGQPRAGLFVRDGLHLNEAGYALWAEVVRPFLDRILPPGQTGQ